MHDGIKTYEVLMRRLLRNWRKQALQAIVGFVVVTLVGFGIYLSIQTLPFLHRGKIVATAKEDKLNSRYFTVTTATLFALEFTFVNSLLEELFWRIYLHRELGGHTGVTATDPSRYSTASSLFPLFGAGTRTAVDSPLQHAEVSESSLLKNAELHNSVAPTTFVSDDDNSGSMRGADSSDEGGDNSIPSSMALPASETPKLLLSAYYASYHVVVMVFFVQWWLAFLGFLGLVVLGRIFVFCRESEHLGVVTAWGIHAGADAAFCLIMLQLYFHFAR